jgi:hypothetical protein
VREGGLALDAVTPGLALDAETPPIVLRAGLRDGSGRASIDGITLKSAQTYSILEHDFELH